MPDLTAAAAEKRYRAVVASTNKPAYAQLPPGKYLKRKFAGEFYYLVAAYVNRGLRDRAATNWQALGYKVEVIGKEVYVRR